MSSNLPSSSCDRCQPTTPTVRRPNLGDEAGRRSAHPQEEVEEFDLRPLAGVVILPPNAARTFRWRKREREEERESESE
eukprot:215147-Hanusia_phi.AAC.1